MDWLVFLPMLTLGLVSSGHCIGMCGGIMGALSTAIPEGAAYKRWRILLSYNVGRIASYSVMGFILGIASAQFSGLGGGSLLRLLAGLLLIVMGLYLADWWRGLKYLEALGRYVWVYLQPLGKNLFPVTGPFRAFLLGCVWGWLPCGLVYSALALALAQPSPWLAGGAMFAFGLGTLPVVLAAGAATQALGRFLRRRDFRSVMAVLIILYGVWTIYSGMGWGGDLHNHDRSHDQSYDQSHHQNHQDNHHHQRH